MTSEEKSALEALAVDLAYRAAGALNDGDVAGYRKHAQRTLALLSALEEGAAAQRPLTEAEKLECESMVDSAIRNAKPGEVVPCPDCHRKDESKCKEGATDGRLWPRGVLCPECRVEHKNECPL